MHGRHNIDSFLNHTAGIGPKNLTDFTICLRFNINFLKPIYNALVSYSTFLEDNAINFEVKVLFVLTKRFPKKDLLKQIK